jgi:hypothetical protein
MTYYDVFMADYLQGATGQREAAQSVTLTQSFNDALSADFATQNVMMADVGSAFDVYTPFSTTVSTTTGTLPVAVAKTCELTWMCSALPIGANIHATVAGYQEIATLFAATLNGGAPVLAGGQNPLLQP